MNWKDLLNELSDAFKVPETKEEAIAWINKDNNMQLLIEEMSFRQVIINILVAAGIITEKDFNASVSHFKTLFTEKFAEELLTKIKNFNQQYDSAEDNDLFDDDEDDDNWDDGKPIGQA